MVCSIPERMFELVDDEAVAIDDPPGSADVRDHDKDMVKVGGEHAAWSGIERVI